ncbi:MAG: S8 family serine peptidase [Parvibaculaceae bacterium]|nr:S8 family serine peptidase [Parvibaculaceae bacterium]
MWHKTTSVLIALALVGCGGGGGGGGGASGASGGGSGGSGGGGTPSETFLAADDGSTEFVTAFNEITATSIRNESEFTAQDKSVIFNLGGSIISFANTSYATINLHYALSTGLTGAGETIAIVDAGYLTTHDEIFGKSISTFGSQAIDDHGTGVASIAAGNWDSSGTLGVAPGADLHLSTYLDSASSVSFTPLANATLDALSDGVIVQNNSWGIEAGGVDLTLQDALDYMTANPGANLSQTLQGISGFSSAGWTNYLSAVDQFTDQGVVVFSASNDDTTTSAAIMAALPELYAGLDDAWIVAVNGYPTHNGGGEITNANLLSAQCMEVAAYCLVADGTVYLANSSGNSSYNIGTGTSFAAPQIAGGVALLAEAFPNIRSDEIVDRLLASANNSFFTPTANVDFGNGVLHGYNSEFGHGYMDLAAALLPIGSLGFATASHATGATAAISTGTISTSGIHGDAFATALSGTNLALFDSLGTDFYVNASLLADADTTSTLPTRLGRYARKKSAKREFTQGGFSFGTHSSTFSPTGWNFGAATAEDMGATFGIAPSKSSIFENTTSILGLAQNGLSLGATKSLKNGALGFYSFADLTDTDEKVMGIGAVRSFNLDGTTRGTSLSFGLSTVVETGSFLGITSYEGGGFEATSSTFNAGANWPMGAYNLFATAEMGLSVGEGTGLVTNIAPTLFSGFAVGVKKDQLFSKNDALTVSLRQPLRIESGNATMRFSVGRDKEGNVLYEDVNIALAPSARQIDLGFDYQTALDENTDLRLAPVASFNHNHTRGELGASAMAVFLHRF